MPGSSTSPEKRPRTKRIGSGVNLILFGAESSPSPTGSEEELRCDSMPASCCHACVSFPRACRAAPAAPPCAHVRSARLLGPNPGGRKQRAVKEAAGRRPTAQARVRWVSALAAAPPRRRVSSSPTVLSPLAAPSPGGTNDRRASNTGQRANQLRPHPALHPTLIGESRRLTSSLTFIFACSDHPWSGLFGVPVATTTTSSPPGCTTRNNLPRGPPCVRASTPRSPRRRPQPVRPARRSATIPASNPINLRDERSGAVPNYEYQFPLLPPKQRKPHRAYPPGHAAPPGAGPGTRPVTSPAVRPYPHCNPQPSLPVPSPLCPPCSAFLVPRSVHARPYFPPCFYR